MNADPLILIASLCDSMKRLEKAVQAADPSTREYYLEEAAKRRKTVERAILKEAGI